MKDLQSLISKLQGRIKSPSLAENNKENKSRVVTINHSQGTQESLKDFSPEKVIQRIESGDKSAEQSLVSYYWRGLLYVLNRHTQDSTLANDIAQDTFITVITKARKGEITSPSGLASFIRQVGINLTIAYYRKAGVSKTDASEDIDVKFADNTVSPTERIGQQQLVEIVVEVIQTLPTERDRELITSYYLHNTPKQTLCSQLSLTPEHFDRVLYRAKERLKLTLSSRLNLDVSHTTLSHLLSLAIVSTLTHSLIASSVKQTPEQVTHSEVGEFYSSSHLPYSRIKDSDLHTFEVNTIGAYRDEYTNK
ncbi:sigma-70 family RNA polymerase sigma factor [Aestuariibacter sp. AA17]|uniref:Sigma-70 family RNA polymerase sigma factor n=1 Tax=Fluctibacter corallii TaxID=2984329 RepID=A0ABT3ACJ7_9ALTE|nr:sigma-70 family RNA polymerase sigma factor [Aestuariibacter sp. AA17]MCV2886392.1 sigma-70 family RNA polymerase sigma factor [Aestuariibacter sp. AA17]